MVNLSQKLYRIKANQLVHRFLFFIKITRLNHNLFDWKFLEIYFIDVLGSYKP
jgi:hypothetical protein